MGLITDLFGESKKNEPHFLKIDSSLEKKVNYLNELQKKYPSNKKIANELRMASSGLKGEKEVEYYLKNSNIEMYVLHDINLVVDDYKAQIDYIIITPANCYLVECKNIFGTVTIDGNGQFIIKYKQAGKYTTEAIESPLRQSERHRDILLKIRNKHKTFFDNIFFSEKLFEKYHKSIVVFTNKKTIINNKYAPKEYKDNVIRVDELVNYIKKDIRNTKSIDRDTNKEMKEYAERFLRAHSPINENYEKSLGLDTKCPDCGGELVERKGYNIFLGCSNFPDCTYKKQL